MVPKIILTSGITINTTFIILIADLAVSVSKLRSRYDKRKKNTA
jgi:hypothetical protein